MKISIVTAYHNRKDLLINTLNSIKFQGYKCDLEIIIVDDASNDENRLGDVVKQFPELNINLIEVNKEDKWWINPCVPFNMGFKQVTGDVVIIQNPECFHMGNVIGLVEKHIKENYYMVFGCYSINKEETARINTLDINPDIYSNALKIISPIKNRIAFDAKHSAWYQHSRYRPELLHFCSAITKKDLDELGGFDERFANGVAKDDREFILRIKRKKMQVLMVDDPFVLHQSHKPTVYDPNLTKINNTLFNQIQREKIIKAN